MEQKEKVVQLVYHAVDEINETLPDSRRMPKAMDTPLMGEDGAIDSLGLTLMIVSIEKRIEDEFGIVLSMVDATTMSEENSPFQSVGKLVEYIDTCLEEKQNAGS